MQFTKPLGIGSLTKDSRHLSHQLQIINEVGFPYQRFIILLILQPQPVTQITPRTGLNNQVGFCFDGIIDDVLNIALHGVVVFAQQNGIPILLVALPRHCDSGTSPQQTAKTTTQWSNIRKTPIRPLNIAHRTEIASQELRDIRQISCSAREDRNVSCPSQPFIALRAVRRNGKEVSIRRPGYILPKLIHLSIGSLVA